MELSEMDAGRDYFIFHNLLVRSHGSTKTLQTCSDTYAEAADSAPQTVHLNVSPTSDNKNVEIEDLIQLIMLSTGIAAVLAPKRSRLLIPC